MAASTPEHAPDIPVLASDMDESTLEASLRAQDGIREGIRLSTEAREALLALLKSPHGDELPAAIRTRLIQDQVLLASHLQELEAAQYVRADVRTDLEFLHAALDHRHEAHELES